MKIVHTADWHVGKTLRGRHRGGEYRDVLNEIKVFLEQQQVDLLLVAGDIFDSVTPSAEAEDIVYNFFHDVSLLGVPSVVIAGNHDSSLRFEAISSLMKLARVHIAGAYDMENVAKNFVTIASRDGSEKACIAMLPFISERVFVRAQDLTTEERKDITHRYSEGMGKAIRDLHQNFPKDTFNILMGHWLMDGAKPGGGERKLYIGDNYAVHAREIPEGIDYIALGHIHLRQSMEASSMVHYCGSPLQMDFGEAYHQKGFLLLEAHPGEPCVPQFIPLKSGKKLEEIHGTFEEINQLIENRPDLKDVHLKITIRTDANSLGLSYQIKKQLPNAVDIRREYVSEKQDETRDTSEWLPDLYKSYYHLAHDQEVPKEILERFESLYQQCMPQES